MSTIDAVGPALTYLAVAQDVAAERLGIAYFAKTGGETNAGHPDYEVRYVEWNRGVASAPEVVGTIVQRLIGLSIAFNPTTGEPTVALVGGAAGFVEGESIYWFQSDAELRRRSGGTWTSQIVATTGDQASCGNPVSDRGLLVGVWPALAHDSTGKLYYAWRDCHDAQFPMQDWGGSDVELAEMTGTSASLRALRCGGNDKGGWGGHINMVLGPGEQPAMVFDRMQTTADSEGKDVIFQRRNPDGSWTNTSIVLTVANTQSGPTLAYDSQLGYGIAVFDRTENVLNYTESANGTVWDAPYQIVGAGSSGWYPSLAMDPINHEPAVAYYHCSARAGLNSDACPKGEDELRVAQRIAGNWRETLVDAEGGFLPKLGFFASGKRFVVYRDVRSGAVKVGIER